MISIIIRTKNEERWIGHCLKQIKKQLFQDFEVVLVDNCSTDYTVEKAKSIMPDITMCNIELFKPGKALNLGIENSKGDYIVCLSAHCIPVNEYWLENLYKEIASDKNIAGVYGKQLPMDQTHDIDRRDMYITFGLDKKVQYKDPFFHNANSILRKDLWVEVPFDEEELNIEDRIWGQEVINKGFHLVYTPASMVYHMHGLHQTNKNTRYNNIARIIEETNPKIDTLPISDYNICAIVPILKDELKDKLVQRILIDILKLFKEIEYFSHIVITTDNIEYLKEFLKHNNFDIKNLIIHNRDSKIKNYSKRVLDIYTDVINYLKKNKIYPDIVLTTDISYPIKNKNILKTCLYELLQNDVDAVIPSYIEKRPTWVKRDEDYQRVDSYEVDQEKRSPVYVGLENVCMVSYSNKIYGYKNFFDNKIEMVVVNSPYFKLHLNDINSIEEYEFFTSRLK